MTQPDSSMVAGRTGARGYDVVADAGFAAQVKKGQQFAKIHAFCRAGVKHDSLAVSGIDESRQLGDPNAGGVGRDEVDDLVTVYRGGRLHVGVGKRGNIIF